MSSFKLEAIFKEHEQKLKKFRLKTDPVDSSKSYEGYMLSEKPQEKSEVTLEYVGNVLKTIGSTIKNIEQGARTFRQIGEGDLSKLEDIGNTLLERLYDKNTIKALSLGKKGFRRVNLNDEGIIDALNQYSSSVVKKESFLDRVNEGIFDFLKKEEPKKEPKKQVKRTQPEGEQLEFPLKIKPRIDKQRAKNREKALRIVRSMSREEKIKLYYILQGMDMQQQYEKEKQQMATEQKETGVQNVVSLVRADPDLKGEIESEIVPEVTPEVEQPTGSFNESNLIFNIENEKKFAKGTQFLLKPESEALASLLNEIGVSQVTLFRSDDKSQGNNTVDVYFYSSPTNTIPQLMFSGLKYAYDENKKAYAVNSKIATKKLPVIYKSSLPVSVNNVDIISRDDANKLIKFNFKPSAFTNKTGLTSFKDKFVQSGAKRGTPGEIYASVSAPFQFSEGKDYYILDASKLNTSFDRNTKFYDQNQAKGVSSKAKSKPKPKATKQPKQTELKF
jgi:hypothetical protein